MVLNLNPTREDVTLIHFMLNTPMSDIMIGKSILPEDRLNRLKEALEIVGKEVESGTLSIFVEYKEEEEEEEE